MSRQPKPYITPDDYLAFERETEYKNEYFDGAVVAMRGANRTHCLIAGNILFALARQLKSTANEVYPSRMRVRVPAANFYIYTDVVVVSGEPIVEDDYSDTLLNPTVLVEVLSKSTASYDRRQKFAYYGTIESLTDYVLVAQESVHVEHNTRQPDGRWMLSDFRSLEDVLQLDSVQCSLALGEIYDKVSLS